MTFFDKKHGLAMSDPPDGASASSPPTTAA